MVQDIVENRVTNPVKMADWGAVDESRGALCPCCGWKGSLGECAKTTVSDARTYSCDQCSMVLVVRVAPSVIPLRVLAGREWWEQDRLNSAVA